MLLIAIQLSFIFNRLYGDKLNYNPIDLDWEEVDLNGSKAYRAEIAYTPFKGKVARINGLKEQDLKTYRLIITKQQEKMGKLICILRKLVFTDVSSLMILK